MRLSCHSDTRPLSPFQRYAAFFFFFSSHPLLPEMYFLSCMLSEFAPRLSTKTAELSHAAPAVTSELGSCRCWHQQQCSSVPTAHVHPLEADSSHPSSPAYDSHAPTWQAERIGPAAFPTLAPAQTLLVCAFSKADWPPDLGRREKILCWNGASDYCR